MKPSLIPRQIRGPGHCQLPAHRRGERGVTMALVAAAMVAIMAMAALSIDAVTLYLANAEAQRSADSAALAAARVISVSGITGTASTATQGPYWQQICGGSTSVATQTAQAVATQNTVGGATATVTTTYSVGTGTPNADCSTLSAGFAVNPLVTVKVQRTLPTFFARIWGKNGSSVSGTPLSRAKRSFSRERQFQTLVASTSTMVQACGAVCFDSNIRCAMILRARLSGITSPGTTGCTAAAR